jgi:lysine 2,3-aminomutase
MPARGSGERYRRPWKRFGATRGQWADWRWQQRHAVCTLAELGRHLQLTENEARAIQRAERRFPLGVTPYYLSLADVDDPWCPVRMQFVPHLDEQTVQRGERVDPLGEDAHQPVPGLVHRYPDRVLYLPLDRCSTYCRHCTRRRRRGGAGRRQGSDGLEGAAAYVAAHPEVRDVLISGGDPFLLADAKLERILRAFRALPHVEILRVGTRMPVCNPMRVTRELAKLLRRYHPVFVVTHFNHPKEVTLEARTACERLVDAGIPVENQTVLLRRVNSSARIMTALGHRLLAMRVRPYYLHQMDVAEGLEHLRTPVEAGMKILEAMRGFTSGLAVPHLAVDLPGGGGKVTLQPDYLVAVSPREAVFRNYRGVLHRYPEPRDRDCRCPYEEKYFASGRAER